ncbi:hypothetical protein [Candidatus Methylomicrobium oryzae]|uniref:hypothetical protein n=1 Tax=Candidatus Methylomicrobium oryzae TaxID=2802053 RepID=UPI001920F3A8|nr:hypothetical protein [Methylomicrobium sp. RS1]MBL1266006.1 hypothetical protein [Methylomicrobium sp. RS1]
MSNSNYFFSSPVGKEVKHLATAAGAAARATALLTAGGSAFPLVSAVAAPAAVASLPLVVGVGLLAYGGSKLLDRLFD